MSSFKLICGLQKRIAELEAALVSANRECASYKAYYDKDHELRTQGEMNLKALLAKREEALNRIATRKYCDKRNKFISLSPDHLCSVEIARKGLEPL